ncbi:MAG: hypothetical protein D3903_14925, partial [Candidatus Electrothrix sp. GM3_4]|nr:hypothetical protein [Candidatus Electrothrix sp. GM3_4]
YLFLFADRFDDLPNTVHLILAGSEACQCRMEFMFFGSLAEPVHQRGLADTTRSQQHDVVAFKFAPDLFLLFFSIEKVVTCNWIADGNFHVASLRNGCRCGLFFWLRPFYNKIVLKQYVFKKYLF